jgi:hypothetical protein
MHSRIPSVSWLGRARAAGAGAAAEQAHGAALDGQLNMLRTTVALEMHCEPDHGSSGEGAGREAFHAHFAQLDDSLEEWNALVDRVQSAPEALWRRFADSARERGITEPPFMVGVLIDQLATWTVERSRRWELEVAQETPIEHFNDRLDGERYVSVYLLGRRVAVLPGGPDAEVERRVERVDALIRALFEEARRCEEAKDIADAQDALLAVKQRLLDELDAHPAGSAIAFSPTCPHCSRSSSANPAA